MMEQRNRLLMTLFCSSCLALIILYVMQHGFGLTPCLLCYPQRWCLWIITATLGLLLLKPKGPIALHGILLLTMMFALMGLALALRHAWIQSLPLSQAPACAPPLEYLNSFLPWHETLRWMLSGSRNCHTIKFSFLGLSLPGWSCVLFTGEILGVTLLWRKILTHK